METALRWVAPGRSAATPVRHCEGGELASWRSRLLRYEGQRRLAAPPALVPLEVAQDGRTSPVGREVRLAGDDVEVQVGETLRFSEEHDAPGGLTDGLLTDVALLLVGHRSIMPYRRRTRPNPVRPVRGSLITQKRPLNWDFSVGPVGIEPTTRGL